MSDDDVIKAAMEAIAPSANHSPHPPRPENADDERKCAIIYELALRHMTAFVRDHGMANWDDDILSAREHSFLAASVTGRDAMNAMTWWLNRMMQGRNSRKREVNDG